MSKYEPVVASSVQTVRRRLVASLLVISAGLVYVMPSRALQCIEIDFDQSYSSADRVIIGQLLTSEPIPEVKSAYRLSFSILDTIKGVASELVELDMNEERYLSPIAYTVGDQYLMFLGAAQTSIHLCEKIVLLNGSAQAWYMLWLNSRASAISLAAECVERSPDSYRSVGGSPLRLSAAFAYDTDGTRKRWLVSIPEERPTTIPQGRDLFVDVESRQCESAPMD